jgi:gas vesicle protein
MDFGIQDLLWDLLHTAKIDEITETFLSVIVLTFLFYTWKQYQHAEEDYRGQGSTILTSLGIAGTFVGILLGLQDFNFNEIQQGITVLLNGLKTAFYTSVTGLGCAIVFQTVAAPLARKYGARKAADTYGDNLQPSDFFDAIQELNQHQQTSSEALEKVSKVLGGDGDSSLLTQLKLSRQDFSEFRKELKNDMENFAEMLSKSATETIIAALKDVISDFNNNLTEQFGENFKRLNDAVFKLVEWQDNYKQQLEQMQSRFDQSIQASERIADATTKVAEEVKSIPEAMDDLSELMEGLNHQIEDLDQHLAAFVQMRDEAVKAVPEIQEHVKTLVTEIASASQQSADLSAGAIQEARNLIDKFGETNTSLVEGFKDAAEKGAKELEEGLARAAEGITGDLDTVKTTFSTMANDFSRESSEMLSTYRSAMTETQTIVTDHQKEMQNVFQDSVDQVRASHTELVQQAKQASDNLLGSLEQMNRDTTDRIRTSVDLSFNELDSKTKGYFGALDEELKETAAKHRSLLEGAMRDLAGVINSEVNQVVREMGDGLKRVSEALVSDIQNLRNLTDRLTKSQDDKD